MNRNDRSMPARLRAPLRLFRRDEEGSISVEAVLILPLLFWVIGATFVYFDAFKTRNAAARATYTITDLIARETQPIDADYLAGAQSAIGQLVYGAQDTRFRVTVIRCNDRCDEPDRRELELMWSEGVGAIDTIRPEAVDTAALRARIPDIGEGASIVMVESEITWNPAFNVGLPELELGNTIVMRPRFSPQVCWESCYLGS